jgi:hypothetical protein
MQGKCSMPTAYFKYCKPSTMVLIAACAAFPWATAQNSTPNNNGDSTEKPAAACPLPTEVRSTDLYGSWTLELQLPGSAAPAVQRGKLTLDKNPEYADSVSGWLELGGTRVFVAGNIEGGSLSLEESDNGERISAVWEGAMAQGSCGKAITGTRRAGDEAGQFVLRKIAGWN